MKTTNGVNSAVRRTLSAYSNNNTVSPTQFLHGSTIGFFLQLKTFNYTEPISAGSRCSFSVKSELLYALTLRLEAKYNSKRSFYAASTTTSVRPSVTLVNCDHKTKWKWACDRISRCQLAICMLKSTRRVVYPVIPNSEEGQWNTEKMRSRRHTTALM